MATIQSYQRPTAGWATLAFGFTQFGSEGNPKSAGKTGNPELDHQVCAVDLDGTAADAQIETDCLIRVAARQAK